MDSESAQLGRLISVSIPAAVRSCPCSAAPEIRLRSWRFLYPVTAGRGLRVPQHKIGLFAIEQV
jgi:hypothetical protein